MRALSAVLYLYLASAGCNPLDLFWCFCRSWSKNSREKQIWGPREAVKTWQLTCRLVMHRAEPKPDLANYPHSCVQQCDCPKGCELLNSLPSSLPEWLQHLCKGFSQHQRLHSGLSLLPSKKKKNYYYYDKEKRTVEKNSDGICNELAFPAFHYAFGLDEFLPLFFGHPI